MFKKIVYIISGIIVFIMSLVGDITTCVLCYKSIIYLTQFKLLAFILGLLGSIFVGCYSLLFLACSIALFMKFKE